MLACWFSSNYSDRAPVFLNAPSSFHLLHASDNVHCYSFSEIINLCQLKLCQLKYISYTHTHTHTHTHACACVCTTAWVLIFFLCLDMHFRLHKTSNMSKIELCWFDFSNLLNWSLSHSHGLFFHYLSGELSFSAPILSSAIEQSS